MDTKERLALIQRIDASLERMEARGHTNRLGYRRLQLARGMVVAGEPVQINDVTEEVIATVGGQITFIVTPWGKHKCKSN